MAALPTITVTIKDFDSFKRTIKAIRRFKWTHHWQKTRRKGQWKIGL